MTRIHPMRALVEASYNKLPMRHLRKILILLCAYLALLPVCAQENDVSKTYCIPVRTVFEADLAYQAGEKLTFTMHYEWGNIDSDVGTGTVVLDTVRFNGQKAFRVILMRADMWRRIPIYIIGMFPSLISRLMSIRQAGARGRWSCR